MNNTLPAARRTAAAPGNGCARQLVGRIHAPLLVLLAATFTLTACPSAGAHGGLSGTPGFNSRVLTVQPSVAGLQIRVVAGDDRLRLRDSGSQTIIINGYQGEPYLRFQRDGVYQNVRSPAVYLNQDRYGNINLPGQANAKAPPLWQRISNAPLYEWHDHRIHWMSTILPPQVRSAPKMPHHVFDWRLQGTANGRRFTIAGSLDYAPVPPGKPISVLLIGPIAALLLALAILTWARRRRKQTTATA
jgi:hypothetical protein